VNGRLPYAAAIPGGSPPFGDASDSPTYGCQPKPARAIAQGCRERQTQGLESDMHYRPRRITGVLDFDVESAVIAR
jgi:hypothetical protein